LLPTAPSWALAALESLGSPEVAIIPVEIFGYFYGGGRETVADSGLSYLMLSQEELQLQHSI
jgi:hypothetical protein